MLLVEYNSPGKRKCLLLKNKRHQQHKNRSIIKEEEQKSVERGNGRWGRLQILIAGKRGKKEAS